MNNIFFLIEINNSYTDYAKCMQFMEQLKGTNIAKYARGILGGKRVQFCESDKTAQYLINHKDLFQSIDQFPSSSGQDIEKSKFILYVNCSDEDDIINFIYFCLLSERYKNQCILCIKPLTEPEKLRANIKDIMKYIVNERPGVCYVWSKEKSRYYELTSTDRVIRRFSPIYFIDEKKESVAFWRQSVQTFLLDFYKNNRMIEKATYLKDYFLPHIRPQKIKTDKEKQVLNLHGNKKMHLIQTFLECFCDGNLSLGKKDIEKRYQFWITEEFFNMIKDIPLLAMYIFCVLDYFSENKKLISIETINNEIFNARDMADGLLQILENIYHSENKRGYFCFRIHNNKNDRSGKYLRKQYAEYMNSLNSSEENVENFLEFKIIDLSCNTITKQFYRNYEKKEQEANENDRKIYVRMKNQAKNLRLKDFFENSEFWENYNSISENAVNHYGLQIFHSLVSCYGGYFELTSRENYLLDTEKEAYCSLDSVGEIKHKNGIPGTQYDIVIPFREQKVPQNISVNVNINYTNYLSHKFEVYQGIDFTSKKCREIFDSISEINKNGVKFTFQEKKDLTIRKLEQLLVDELEKQMASNESIIYFSAKNISLTMIELFCKAIMLYIAKRDRNGNKYIMITDCSPSHFVEITRMFALYYDKQGHNSFMKNTQIFLSGVKEGEEFLISGANLSEVIGRTEKLAFARCVHPECLTILKNMLKYRIKEVTPNETVNIVPFDMINYEKNKPTLFERSLKTVLNKDVQSTEFGCKIEDLHVRIGSKIHIRTFYEAELLFHNNYYTSRFSYWILNQIRENEKIEKTKPITLVGYENYSEMLLNELQTMLIETGYQSEYIVYEQKAQEKFRSGKPIEEYRNTQFVFIVPINSTTSTHVKLSGFLKKSIRNALKTKLHEENYGNYEFESTVNYGVILISSRTNNEYWKKEKEHIVISSINNERMYYYIEVESVWSDPLDCKDCFPDEDYLKEVPLVETNKESVVPMHAIGLRGGSEHGVIWKFSSEEKKQMRELSNFLVYDHVERNGNHYSYYFSTEKLWEFPAVRANIQKWLKSCRKKFTEKNKKVYDIIVAPLHPSNAAFVEEVNRSLFGSAALVLHFDVNKEYRTNIRAKYSNIQQLYDNLSNDQEESIINFHYVDDTIISGQTFYRTKSLIRSLILQKENNPVKINIFKSVVVLINRMSKASIINYIDQPEFFMVYFNLNISSMRVIGDACVLCKKRSEWARLAEQASLNEVYSYWSKKCEKIECKPAEKLWKYAEKHSAQRQKREMKYMFASHMAKSLMESMYGLYTNTEIERQIIEDLFPNPERLDFEMLIAVLKVLGRPFLNFRKEGREIAFHLLLKMLDMLLEETEPSEPESQKLDKTMKKVWNNPQKRVIIVTILINLLVEMESNYIIRKKSIRKIMNFAKKIRSVEKQGRFKFNYFNRIKCLVGQSNDFAKCLYLEYLLLYGKEYDKNYMSDDFMAKPSVFSDSELERKIYLENTKILDYGIVMLADCVKNENKEKYNFKRFLNENYYFDNFITYLAFYKIVEVDQNGQVSKFLSEDGGKKIQGMVQFENFYEDLFREDDIEERGFQKNTFIEMMAHLITTSGAEDGEIIVPYKPDDGEEEYVALELAQKNRDVIAFSKDGRELAAFMNENVPLTGNDFMKKQKDSFVGNTYNIIEKEDQRWILLKFCDQNDKKSNSIPVIYMLFTFNRIEDRKMYAALKNILVFRGKIWRILNLSSNTLVQNWASGLFYKQQMLKARATSHGSFDELIGNLNELVGQVDIRDQVPFYDKCFEQFLNSAIGHWNVQMLGREPAGHESDPYYLREFLRDNMNRLSAAEKIWNMKLEIINIECLKENMLRACSMEKKKKQYPQMELLEVLFLAILQNASKHGLKENGMINVSVYKEGSSLCFKNKASKEKYEEISLAVQDKAYRQGQGISMAVIADVCKSWYGDIKYSDIFRVFEENESCCFLVKLPIFVKEDA